MRVSWKTSLAGIGLALLGQGPLTAGEFGMGSRSRFDEAPPGQGWSGYSQDRGPAPPQEGDAAYGLEPARNPWEAGATGSERVAPEERTENRSRHSSFFSRRRSLVPDGEPAAGAGEEGARSRPPARRAANAPSPSRAHPEATPDFPAGGVNDEYKRHEMEVTRLQRKLEDAERDDNPRKIKAINWMIAQENERHDKELAKAERRENQPKLHAARHEDPELPPPQGRERSFAPPSASGMAEEANHAGWLFGSGGGNRGERGDRGARDERASGPAPRFEDGGDDHDHDHGAPAPTPYAALPSEDTTVGYPPAYATRAREVPVAPRQANEHRFSSEIEPGRASTTPAASQRNLPAELGFQDREW